MFIQRPPQMPLPPRECFDTHEDYLKAREAWLHEKKRRSKAVKTDEAIMIVFAGCMVLLAAAIMVSMAYFSAGWNGVIGLLLTGGLLWAAVSRVKMWL